MTKHGVNTLPCLWLLPVFLAIFPPLSFGLLWIPAIKTNYIPEIFFWQVKLSRIQIMFLCI